MPGLSICWHSGMCFRPGQETKAGFVLTSSFFATTVSVDTTAATATRLLLPPEQIREFANASPRVLCLMPCAKESPAIGGSGRAACVVKQRPHHSSPGGS